MKAAFFNEIALGVTKAVSRRKNLRVRKGKAAEL